MDVGFEGCLDMLMLCACCLLLGTLTHTHTRTRTHTHTHTHTHIYIYIYIYIQRVKLTYSLTGTAVLVKYFNTRPAVLTLDRVSAKVTQFVSP